MNVTFQRIYFEGPASRAARLPTARRLSWLARNIELDHARAATVASYQAATDDMGKLDEDELARIWS